MTQLRLSRPKQSAANKILSKVSLCYFSIKNFVLLLFLCTLVFSEYVLVITNAAYFKLNSSTLNVILPCCILLDRLHEDNGSFIWCELIVKVQLGWLLIHFSGSFMNKLTIFSKLITPVLIHVYFRVHQAQLVFKAWLELLVQLWVFCHLLLLSDFFFFFLCEI